VPLPNPHRCLRRLRRRQLPSPLLLHHRQLKCRLLNKLALRVDVLAKALQMCSVVMLVREVLLV
tara:strand:+ start:617 stop:808 length:192 start_codon:yes stop_codon:yes gene_type:complete